LSLSFVTGEVGGETEVFIGEYWPGFGHSVKVAIGGDAVRFVSTEHVLRIINVKSDESVTLTIS